MIPSLLPHKDSGEIRKLVYFPDREDKVRVVAELDYFSQSVLIKLHDFLFSVLKRIPQDRTFSQGDFKNFQEVSLDSIYSVDLKDATDRFPIEIIKSVLKARLPAHYVDS